jgi:hypothetical protein
LTEDRRVDVGAVASNDSTLLKVSLPALTTRWRQADHLGKFDAGLSCVRLQGVQNLLIKLINFAGSMQSHGYVRPTSESFSAKVRIFSTDAKAILTGG